MWLAAFKAGRSKQGVSRERGMLRMCMYITIFEPSIIRMPPPRLEGSKDSLPGADSGRAHREAYKKPHSSHTLLFFSSSPLPSSPPPFPPSHPAPKHPTP